MSCGKPNWQLLLDCARELTSAGKSPFTRRDLIRCVQRIHPAALDESLHSAIQGMTANARGGPRPRCEPLLRRVARGQYVLVASDEAVAVEDWEARTPRPPVSATAVPRRPNDELDLLTDIEVERSLVVLPCSAAKRSGGQPPDLHQAHGITEWLPEELRDEFVEARARVAPRAKIDETRGRPALERYEGYLYGVAGSYLGEVAARARGVVILSGGYGAVLADEPIGTYDAVLRPADWPDGLLGRVLVATAHALEVDAVVAFLSRSTAYARIVRAAPWSPGGPWVGLVSPESNSAGGAMVTVPRSLGDALAGYVTGELRSGWTSSDGLGLRLEVVSSGHGPSPRPTRRQPTLGARDARVEAAIARFRDPTQFVSARMFPDGLGELDTPGLYAWRVDDDGARTLQSVLGCSCGGLVYVGQAGATRWPSGNATQATLRSRIRGQHLGGNIRSSTFRRTLAALLVDELDLCVDDEARLHGEGEERLSSWIAEHLAVAVQATEDCDAFGAIEAHVVATLDPPLNLDHVPRTAWRDRLRERRSVL